MAKGHKDKVAVITGAANGIGQAFAKRLAEDGVHIAIADIAPGDQTVKMVEAAGRQALACQCDVTSQQSVAAMAARGAEEVRPLRHPDQLRRHLPADRVRRDEVRGLAARAVDQSRQRVPGLVGLGARHEAARLGPHRQHGVEHARLGGHRLRALHGEQGRRGRLHPGAGERARPARHHGQRDLAGADALARHAGAQAAAHVRQHGGGIRRQRQPCRRSSGPRCRTTWSAPCPT